MKKLNYIIMILKQEISKKEDYTVLNDYLDCLLSIKEELDKNCDDYDYINYKLSCLNMNIRNVDGRYKYDVLRDLDSTLTNMFEIICDDGGDI